MSYNAYDLIPGSLLNVHSEKAFCQPDQNPTM